MTQMWRGVGVVTLTEQIPSVDDVMIIIKDEGKILKQLDQDWDF